MRLFGFEISRVNARTLSPVDGGGRGGWLNVVSEPWSGAWQRHIALDAPRDIVAFSAVFSSVSMIAADIAKLRIKLVEEDADGITSEVRRDSPFLSVLRKPNRYQTRIKFIEQWIISKLLHGNAYALKQRDNRSMVEALYLLNAQRVTPLVTEDGGVYYRLDSDALSGLREQITVPARDIIHDTMNALWHPLVGISPIYACGMSATMGNRIQRNSTNFFANMSRPSGMLTAPHKISDELANRLKTKWDENFGGHNLGRLAVGGEGLKYEAMTIPAIDAQLIEQLKWTVEDVGRCFHVPLFKLGGPVPVGNTVEAGQQIYYNDCLHTLIESAELCLDEGVELPPKYSTEFDLDNLLRMDMGALIKAEAEGVGSGIKAPNESRKRLNLKPVAGGDSPYLQQQNFSLEALAKRDALDDPFAKATPAKEPGGGKAPNDPPIPAAANDAQANLLVDFFVKELDCANA